MQRENGGEMVKGQSVIILAGGFGKRIKSAWDGPKGLIPYLGKTILWHVLAEISESKETREITLVSNAAHLALYQQYCLKEGFDQVRMINDGAEHVEEARGALNDLLLGLDEARAGDVMVLPCDTVTKGVFALADFANFGHLHQDGVGVVARKMKKEEIRGRFGNVLIDQEQRITQFVEKPSEPISVYASAAIYYYPANTREWVREYLKEGNNAESTGMIIPWLLAKKRNVYGYETPGGIIDVGSPAEFPKTEGKK